MRLAILKVARWRHLFCGEAEGVSGATPIEFALVLPVLVLSFVSVVDVGLGFLRSMQVQSAAQAGADYAAARGFDQNGITSAVTNATTWANISLAQTPQQFCGCAQATGITSATCGASCPSGKAAGRFVTVATAATYTTLLRYPAVPASFALAAQATVRVK